MDVDEDGVTPSGFDTRQIPTATDFELPDYWDEGEALQGRESWPICVTLNIVSCNFIFRRCLNVLCQDLPVSYLDATPAEEAATPLKLLLMYSFPPASGPQLQGIRLLGPGETQLAQMKQFVTVWFINLAQLITI